MKHLILLLCLLSLQVWVASGKTPEYHKVVAKKGDDIKGLLRRYQLDQEACNREKFLALNKLKKNARLIAGKTYVLPVLLYPFDRKTIRSSLDIDDWTVAKRIDNYNKWLLKNELRQKSIRESDIIWVPYHELFCQEEPAVAIVGKNRVFPIFGKKFEKVPLLDKKLKGKVFYVDPGHGGPDPGAIGRSGKSLLCEDEYAYDVSIRLVYNLLQHGATVYLITRDQNDGIREDKILKCDSDELCWPAEAIPLNQKQRLLQRSQAVNRLYRKHLQQGVKDQKLIIIHVDSRNKGKQIDVFFYHKSTDKIGKKLAEKLKLTFEKNYDKYQPDRGYEGSVSSRDLLQLRESKPPAVYIEIGNIRNSFDQQRFLNQDNRMALANWLCEGFLK